MKFVLRFGLAASLAVSAVIHAYLYIHGYQHIPTIGMAFLIQASVSFALALLIVVGGPWWLSWAAAAVAAEVLTVLLWASRSAVAHVLYWRGGNCGIARIAPERL